MKIALARQRRGPFNSKNVISFSSQNIVKHNRSIEMWWKCYTWLENKNFMEFYSHEITALLAKSID